MAGKHAKSWLGCFCIARGLMYLSGEQAQALSLGTFVQWRGFSAQECSLPPQTNTKQWAERGSCLQTIF